MGADRTLYLRYSHGDDLLALGLVDPGRRAIEAGRPDRLTISFSSGSVDAATTTSTAIAPTHGRTADGATGLFATFRGRDLLDKLAVADRARLALGAESFAVLDLSGMGETVARLTDCATNTLMVGATSEQVAAASRGIFSSDDYPAGPLRAYEQGQTTVRLAIGPDGRVSDCQVTVSSGSAALDLATCRIIRSRARLFPALNRQGNAMTTPDETTVTWRLPPRPVEPAASPPPAPAVPKASESPSSGSDPSPP
jgi:TonB family protein